MEWYTVRHRVAGEIVENDVLIFDEEEWSLAPESTDSTFAPIRIAGLVLALRPVAWGVADDTEGLDVIHRAEGTDLGARRGRG